MRETETTAPIIDVQRFSLHDGPGIRTLIFFKGCNLHCNWCQNPESQATGPVVAFYSDHCHENFDCATVCPEDAIQKNGFRIDYNLCSTCGECVKACAFEALRLIGRQTTPADLLEQIRPDLPYFQRDNGGITFTGGEPTLQSHFIETFLDICDADQEFSNMSLHKNIETAALFNYKKKYTLLKRFDLIYVDLKPMQSNRHVQATGMRNDIIHENAVKMVHDGLPVEFRIPLIPGYTDDVENLRQAIEFLNNLKQTKVHLLKYHNMGESKIDIINGLQPRLNLSNYDEDRFQSIKADFERYGFEVKHH